MILFLYTCISPNNVRKIISSILPSGFCPNLTFLIMFLQYWILSLLNFCNIAHSFRFICLIQELLRFLWNNLLIQNQSYSFIEVYFMLDHPLHQQLLILLYWIGHWIFMILRLIFFAMLLDMLLDSNPSINVPIILFFFLTYCKLYLEIFILNLMLYKVLIVKIKCRYVPLRTHPKRKSIMPF